MSTKHDLNSNSSLSVPRGIYIKGARQHNLKNITVNIPRNALVVVTGVSGSGKSSLVIDTLFAEGQRRYVESLSAYARQFLGRMNKPEVDYIHGLSPAIAIEQRVISNAARSTVGTLTEIYDYLRLLYARLGKTYSPVSGQLVRKDEVSDIVDYLFNLPNGERVVLAVPLSPDISKSEKNTDAELNLLLQKGYSRLWLNNTLVRIEDVQTSPQPLLSGAMVMIDRFSIDNADNDLRTRCADSVNLAFYEGHGHCTIIHPDKNEWRNFSNKFEADGLVFEEPSPQFFHFNNPYGACQTCEGFGQTIGIDENLVIPDHSLSVYEGAIAPWKGEKMGEWLDFLVANSSRFNFPIHRPIAQLTPQEYQLLWTGNKYFEGINAFFKMLQENSYKMHYRIMMAKYRGRTICPDCLGSRLRKEVQYVKIGQKSLIDLVLMPISDLQTFFSGLSLNDFEQAIGKRILIEITHRLNVLINLGLGYITLNRNSATLSGGETQRIHLTRILGSNLTNALYILDEPSIGLHPRDTDRLVQVLQNLRALGNTVIVVEHEEAVMKAADYLIDIGPLAGQQGGEIVFEGKPGDLLEQAKNPENKSLTAQYLSGKMAITPPTHTRPPLDFIIIENASHHNLKNVTAKFPIGCFTVVTGVSGSGKTTLVKDILYPALQRHLTGLGNQPGRHEKITGYLQGVTKLELIDQNPLGRSSRSNPVTYIKAYDAIRDLYCSQQLAKIRGYKTGSFSFNVAGGRCDTCNGEGVVTIEMQFLADVHLLCEACNGKRFKPDILEVHFGRKNIYDVLEMSVEEAIDFFKPQHKDIATKLQPLADVGLGYVKLGQSSSTLSGGEAQRLKLATYLGQSRTNEKVLFIFDEPSTGLHFNDIKKLLSAFYALTNAGHTVIVVEHNLDIIKCADWVIDLGPDGGSDGGYILYQGHTSGLLTAENSHTAKFIREKIQFTS